MKYQIPLTAYRDPIVKKLFPDFPCFETFLGYLDVIREEVQEFITNEMSNKYFTICADGWTDASQRRYMGIDVHFQDSDSHSVTAKSVTQCMEEYQLDPSKLYSMTTDSAALMPKAAAILKTEWFPCFAHLFHLSFEQFNMGIKLRKKLSSLNWLKKA